MALEFPSGHLKLCHSKVLGEARTPQGEGAGGSFKVKTYPPHLLGE